MFPDRLLPNLLIFLVGQAAVVGLLRTGLLAPGMVLVLATWLTADGALVARLVFGYDGPGYVAMLVAMQLLSIGGAVWFAHGRWRRSRPAATAARTERFREAMRLYVRNELDPAVRIVVGLCRRDPWDVPARLLRAQIDAAAGRVTRARATLRGARGLAGAERYADLIHGELQALERSVVPVRQAGDEPPTELPRPERGVEDAAPRRTRVIDRARSKSR